MRQLESHSPEETGRIAAAIARTAQGGDFIALEGELGSGKTTFVQAFCSALGITEGVRSPTFVLVQVYKAPQFTIYHLDLYRLEDARELDGIGAEEMFWGDDVCLVEWADRFPQALPQERLTVRLTAGEQPEDRQIDLIPAGPRAEAWLQDVQSRVDSGYRLLQ